MERSSSDGDENEKKMIGKPLLTSPTPSTSKGGVRTLPFIIANEAFERVASVGLMSNMILYLTQEYGMEAAHGANVIFIWVAATNFTPIVGAFLADSCLGRFPMIAIGSIISFLGMLLLCLTSMFPPTATSPSGCSQVSENCQKSPSTLQLLLLFAAFALMALGAGGVRSSSLAFGADQLTENPNPKNPAILQSFFSWYYATSSLASLVAVTVVVYVQDSMGWKVGFALPALLMLLSTISLFLATPLYVKLEATSKLITGFAQVIVVSYKKRHIQLSSLDNHSLVYCRRNESRLLMPSEKFRFLNKACATRNPEQELTLEGKALDPWSLCTIDQVEELKALIKVMPIWSTGIIFSLTIDQNTFSTLLAKSMDQHLTPKFEFPAGSFGTFMILALIMWVAIYDRVIIPIASKVKGKQVRLSLYQRMGSGILCCSASMLSIAIVESIRRELAPQATVSAIWLVPYQVLLGIGEALTGIAQIEFFYSEMPKTMSSIASNLFILGMSVASLLASAISSIVDEATGRGGESWVSTDVNKGHYDYYFFLLAGLCFINFLFFLGCSKAYGPCKGDGAQVVSGEDDDQITDEL